MSPQVPVLDTFEVPLDHDRPGGARLRLRFGRIACHRPEHPPVVYLAGGPGESGISAWDHPPFREAIERLALRADVILLDQRGCGESEPIERLEPLPSRPDRLHNPEALLDDLLQRIHEARSRPAGPYLIPGQSARDIPHLAQHLGTSQVDLWAYSYGTHLAMHVDGRCVRRAVFCGFEGLDQTFKLPRNVLDVLGAMETGGAIPPGTVERLCRLRSQSSPIVSSQILLWMLGTWTGLSRFQPRIAPLLDAWDAGEPATLYAALNKFLEVLTRRPPTHYLCDFSSSMSESRARMISEQAQHTQFEMLESALFQRAGEPFRPVDEVTSALKLNEVRLVIFGDRDAFTPPVNLRCREGEILRPRSVVIAGAAHDTLLNDAGARDTLVHALHGERCERD